MCPALLPVPEQEPGSPSGAECPLLSTLLVQLLLAELRELLSETRFGTAPTGYSPAQLFPEKATSEATGETSVCLHGIPVIILKCYFSFILCALQKATGILDALVMITGSDGISVILLLHFMLLFLFALQYDYEYDENGERVILGKGTYGIVYAGRDLSNQVRIAIKEIPERDSRYSNSG